MGTFTRMTGFVKLLILASIICAEANPEKAECTEGLKARASIKFSECQEPLLPVKQCYQLYPRTLGWVQREIYLERNGNNSHEAEGCKKRKKQTSCSHLTYLIQVCGGHYDTCHDKEEKREIMRMWIKQFVRGTHEVYWEFAFSDNNKEIIDGDCNDLLNEFFDDEEVDEIISFVNTGPNLFEERLNDYGSLKHEMLKNTKVSNLTQNFGVLKDKYGKRIGSDKIEEVTIPSHWKYCSWKLKHTIDKEGYSSALAMGLYKCDGKCNTNEGDDQEWIDSRRYSYNDVETDEYHSHEYLGEEEFKNCILKTEINMSRGVSYYAEKLEPDWVKMELCWPFKNILENCTIPLYECIGDIGIKEIVMAEVLKKMLANTRRAMEIIENSTSQDLLGSFTFDDCVIFGGKVAKAPLNSATLRTLTILFFIAYFFNPML